MDDFSLKNLSVFSFAVVGSIKYISWLNLRLWTAKRGKSKSDSSMKKQPTAVFYKKDILKNFTKFTGKHLCRNVLRLLKLQAWRLQLYEFSFEKFLCHRDRYFRFSWDDCYNNEDILSKYWAKGYNLPDYKSFSNEGLFKNLNGKLLRNSDKGFSNFINTCNTVLDKQLPKKKKYVCSLVYSFKLMSHIFKQDISDFLSRSRF